MMIISVILTDDKIICKMLGFALPYLTGDTSELSVPLVWLGYCTMALVTSQSGGMENHRSSSKLQAVKYERKDRYYHV